MISDLLPLPLVHIILLNGSSGAGKDKVYSLIESRYRNSNRIFTANCSTVDPTRFIIDHLLYGNRDAEIQDLMNVVGDEYYVELETLCADAIACRGTTAENSLIIDNERRLRSQYYRDAMVEAKAKWIQMDALGPTNYVLMMASRLQFRCAGQAKLIVFTAARELDEIHKMMDQARTRGFIADAVHVDRQVEGEMRVETLVDNSVTRWLYPYSAYIENHGDEDDLVRVVEAYCETHLDAPVGMEGVKRSVFR